MSEAPAALGVLQWALLRFSGMEQRERMEGAASA
jgi:hypothetical protein